MQQKFLGCVDALLQKPAEGLASAAIVLISELIQGSTGIKLHHIECTPQISSGFLLQMEDADTAFPLYRIHRPAAHQARI